MVSKGVPVKKYSEVPTSFHEKNERRLALIKKKYTNSLSRLEEIELRRLEAEVAQILQPAGAVQYNQSA